ncbi:MAG: radical SAM protein [Gemmatimonadetes bacterium]|nr:MAG: radical SAM protein [Gemmatimonadota bacterium]
MQHTMFIQEHTPSGFPPVLGEQKDIRYFGTDPRSLLNSPATTGMSFWSINPYVGCAFGCAYCYARYAHRYVAERLTAANATSDGAQEQLADLPPWLAFERRVFVKREAGAILRRELRRPARLQALHRETVVIGTATDPYQPAERRFRITRGVLETLAEHDGLSVTIITKSPLVTRDADLLVRIAARSRLSVHVSLITADRELARRLEPRAPTPEARLRAIARLRAHGIEVGVNVMPVLPGITDAPRLLESLVRAVAESKASYLGACALRLQSAARQRYLPFIEAEFPHLAPRYRSTYGRSALVGERYRQGLRDHFRALCAEHGVVYDRYYKTEDDADDASDDDAAAATREPSVQLPLPL